VRERAISRKRKVKQQTIDCVNASSCFKHVYLLFRISTCICGKSCLRTNYSRIS